jgi:hypothetical protein
VIVVLLAAVVAVPLKAAVNVCVPTPAVSDATARRRQPRCRSSTDVEAAISVTSCRDGLPQRLQRRTRVTCGRPQSQR